MQFSMLLLSISRHVIYVVILALYMAVIDPEPSRRALYAVSAAFFVASSSIIVGWIPAPRRLRVVLLWLEIGLVTILNWIASAHEPGGPMPALYTPIVVTLPLELDRRAWVPAAVFVALGWQISSLANWQRLTGSLAYFTFGIYGSLVLFAGSVGLLVRNLIDGKDRSEALLRQVNESQAALERAHRQLQESAASQQELAVLEERQRLTREIHDSVAHGLTALVVQIQAGRRLMERAPEQAAATIARCEEVAREALQDTRRAVRALRPSGLDGQNEVEALRRLGRDFGIATGMDVEVTADAAAQSLPADPVRLEQLYRIFQEALTNAHRHGQARKVKASLSASEDLLHLVITNDGPPPERLEPGVGLNSMVERARSLGGSVTFEPGDRGLTIHGIVPVKGESS